MSMLCTLIRGQMYNTFFQLGGKCPPLSITRGADVLIYHFSYGGQMSEGANVLHYSVVPVPLPVTFAVKSPRSPYLDNQKAFILGP